LSEVETWELETKMISPFFETGRGASRPEP